VYSSSDSGFGVVLQSQVTRRGTSRQTYVCPDVRVPISVHQHHRQFSSFYFKTHIFHHLSSRENYGMHTLSDLSLPPSADARCGRAGGFRLEPFFGFLVPTVRTAGCVIVT